MHPFSLNLNHFLYLIPPLIRLITQSSSVPRSVANISRRLRSDGIVTSLHFLNVNRNIWVNITALNRQRHQHKQTKKWYNIRYECSQKRFISAIFSDSLTIVRDFDWRYFFHFSWNDDKWHTWLIHSIFVQNFRISEAKQRNSFNFFFWPKKKCKLQYDYDIQRWRQERKKHQI